MAYTVLARKYRPQTFADLAGQEHVTRTLSNAIESERVAHAFLFTGVRGVGKTTTARILAKALNCIHGPTPNPCGVCEICTQIAQGTDMDVLEMDGASNNSVEDVRRLQESIPYRPTRDRFKVVIVDEVHMLSVGAFNAFLKTLEEPPPHVKFIFATTEVHKVPITIRSRCQRYDFRLIPQNVITERIRSVLNTEKIEADEQALSIVAREAAGSMRDALTLLDQLVAFGGTTLVGDQVARVLGIAGRELLHRIAGATIQGDGADILITIEQMAEKGLDMLHFARQLVAFVRDLVVLRVSGRETDLVALVEEERNAAIELIGGIELAELQRSFNGISKLVDEVAFSAHPRMTLEMGLVRLATRPALRPLTELLARLHELEQRMNGGGPPRGGGGRPRSSGSSAGTIKSPVAQPRTRERKTRSSKTSAISIDPEAPSPPAQKAKTTATDAEVSAQVTQNSVANAKPDSALETPAKDQKTDVRPAEADMPLDEAIVLKDETAANENESASVPMEQPVAVTPAVRAPKSAVLRAVPSSSDAASSATQNPEREGTDVPPVTAVDAPPPPPANLHAVSSHGGNQLNTDQWETIVTVLMEKKPALGAVLQHGVPVELSTTRIVLAFDPGSFFARQAESTEAKESLAAVAERVCGCRPSLEVSYAAAGTTDSRSLVALENERKEARLDAARKKALNHPLVLEARQLFNIPKEKVRVRVDSE